MDVISLGETMVLFTPESSGPLRHIHRFNKTIGGAESNVCIALARLGHQTGWVSQLGDDEFGLYVRNAIRGEGVDTSRVDFRKDAPTGVFFKQMNHGQDPAVYYYRSNSAARHMTSDWLDDAYLSQARFIHLTGITPALSQSCKQTVYHIIKEAHKNKQTLVFDPNIRLKLWGKSEAQSVLLDIARQCQIVMPGIEEGKLLTGRDEPEDMATALLTGETKAVVIKLGSEGAFYATHKKHVYVKGETVSRIIDTTGAGDGFAAGFLSGLIRGWDYQQAVQLGNQVGAHAITVAGDIEGYPYWSEINSDADKILR